MRQKNVLVFLCGLLMLSLPAAAPAAELFFQQHFIASNYPTDPVDIRAIDMDGDSDIDLVTGSTSFGHGDLSWWENDGSQNFTEHSISSGEDNIWNVEPEDMDNDGDLDILVMRDDEYINFRVTVWVNDGNQNFTPHDIAASMDQQYWVYLIDLDQDGDVDVVSRKAALGGGVGQVVWLENESNLAFTEHIIASINNPYVSAADLDSDGDEDVIVWSPFLQEIHWWENDGYQNFTGHMILDSSAPPVSVVAADLDNDNDMDLLVGVNNYISTLENDGNQNFSEHVISTSVIDSPYVHAADLDGDGDGDVDALAASYWDTYVRWYENEGGFSFAEHSLPGPGSYSPRTADLDGDNDVDIIATVRFHHEIVWWENYSNLVSGDLTCVPAAGTVPFDVTFSVTMWNNLPQTRLVAGRVDARLGGGQFFSNLRAGYTVIDGDSSFETSWVVTTPEYPNVVGENLFTLNVEDVTPAPYNQPPYPPSGGIDTDACTVTGIAP